MYKSVVVVKKIQPTGFANIEEHPITLKVLVYQGKKIRDKKFYKRLKKKKQLTQISGVQ